MIGDTLSSPLEDLDRYLAQDYDPGALTPPRPASRPLELEMRIRLDDGQEVTVVEQAATMNELSEAVDRARVRLAMTLARGIVDAYPSPSSI